MLKQDSVSIPLDILNKLYPDFVIINKKLSIVACGDNLRKQCNPIIGKNINDVLYTENKIDLKTFDTIQNLQNKDLVMRCCHNNTLCLKGSFHLIQENNSALFLGSLFSEEIEGDFSRQFLTKEFFEKITNNIPADVVVFDKQHRYLFINPNAIKDDKIRTWLTGKKDEDYALLKNKPIESFAKRREIFTAAIQEKRLQSFEEKIIKPDGNIQWILRNFYPVINKENNDVEYVLGYGIDITDIKKFQQELISNQEKYKDLFDNSLAIITTHDLNGKILGINQMVNQIYGYSEEEVIGRCVFDFVPKDDQAFFNDYIKQVKEFKQASGTIRFVHKTGKILYAFYNNFLKQEEGKEPYVIGFAVDITGRIIAEKELELSKKKSEELALAKQLFLANMSHEIRTPMNVIVGIANLLQKTDLNEKQKYFLDIITSTSDHLLKIINDILDLSRIESGKLKLEKITFNMQSIIKRTKEVMFHKAEEKGILLLNSQYDNKIYPYLIGDPHRINQLLLNIVSNAIKFTNKGFVNIDCKLVSEDVGSQKIEIKVFDTGIGIEESFLKKIFDKFTQEDSSDSRNYGGTGLGLSICKELVELMGGEIFVDSQKGKGTVFRIVLNLQKGKKTIDDIGNIQTIDDRILNKKQILVVDDNTLNRKLVTIILENYGVTVDEANNGKVAIKKITDKKYDLVLMDIEMPVMDGVGCTYIVRNRLKSNVPIIALTAFAFAEDREKFLIAGMNDYVSKPFQENDLIKIIIKNLSKTTDFKEAVINKKYSLHNINAIAKGNRVFVKEVVELFIEEIEKAKRSLKSDSKKKDYLKIKKTIHKIKPNITCFDISCISNEIKYLDGVDFNEIDNALFESYLDKVITNIGLVAEQMKYDFGFKVK